MAQDYRASGAGLRSTRLEFLAGCRLDPVDLEQ